MLGKNSIFPVLREPFETLRHSVLLYKSSMLVKYSRLNLHTFDIK